jgi:hypothetical protein
VHTRTRISAEAQGHFSLISLDSPADDGGMNEGVHSDSACISSDRRFIVTAVSKEACSSAFAGRARADEPYVAGSFSHGTSRHLKNRGTAAPTWGAFESGSGATHLRSRQARRGFRS